MNKDYESISIHETFQTDGTADIKKTLKANFFTKAAWKRKAWLGFQKLTCFYATFLTSSTI